jgi:hypothetical protein
MVGRQGQTSNAGKQLLEFLDSDSVPDMRTS